MSVFDQPAPMIKGNGQPGVNQMAPPPAAPAPQQAPQDLGTALAPTPGGPQAGFGQAILEFIKSLVGASGPRAITDRKTNVDTAVEKAS